MTRGRNGGYGARPVTKLAKFLAVAAVLCGCNDASNRIPPPLDRFVFPTGMALRHVLTPCAPGAVCSTCQGGTPGCQTLLYVASTNFDLSYDPDTGGTVMAVDPDRVVNGQPLAPPALVGDPVRMGSFAGQLAVLDESTCPGWEDGTRPPLALVTSRSLNAFYPLLLAADGAPSCGSGCPMGLQVGIGDPFGVALSCRSQAGASPDVSAWISYQNTLTGQAMLSQIPFATATPSLALSVILGSAAVYEGVYEPLRDRLYFTSRFIGGNFTPLRYVDLGFLSGTVNPVRLDYEVAGAETTGLAISSDATRAYVALRLYDPDLAVFVRPPDIGGALAVVDLTDVPAGGPYGRLLRLVPLPLGPSEVRAIARPGMRDLVAITCTTDSSLVLYDDDTGSVARVIGADRATGAPLLGRSAFGLAIESPWQGPTSTGVRLFVASFDQSFVSIVQIDDPTRPAGADLVRALDAPNPACTPALCGTSPTCSGASCPPICLSASDAGCCPAACLPPMRVGPERR